MNQSLSGEYLKKLYTENKLNDHFLTHENLKTLLNYELDNLGDEAEADSNFEIIDFCIEKLKEVEPPPDEQKLDFLGQKIMLEAKEIDRQNRVKKYKKWGTTAAAVTVIVCGLFISGTEGFAGKFDLVHRLIWQDKGEQVAVSTPNMTLSQVEYEPGHLPERMPDEFAYIESEQYMDSFREQYIYHFQNTEEQKLVIEIQHYTSQYTIYKTEQETNKKAFKTETINDKAYYYIINKNTNFISWVYNQNLYIIKSSLSFEKLEDVLSLYREEQSKK